VYLGAANLWRYIWWSNNYGGDYTDTGMWTREAVTSYVIWGSFFTTVGALGVVSGLLLWFKALPAVAENNRAYLRKILLPIAIIGIPAGVVIAGVMLIFVWLMYSDDRYDFFGLLLEDVTRTRRRAPTPVATPSPTDGRDAYAQGYQEQSLYTDDYAQAAYGGGEGAYTAGVEKPLVAPRPQPAPAAQARVPQARGPPARAPPAAAPQAAPMCRSCGKPTEWIEEYGRYYCYDCDAYV
jgi:hypothetical protein